MALEDQMEEVFVQALDLDGDVDVKTLKYRGIERWDSLAHMELIMAIEERFGIVLDPVEVLKINSFVAAVSIVAAKSDATADA